MGLSPEIENLTSYSIFASYYRTLIKHRSHAEPIARLLKELLAPSHKKLLDAACGQGNNAYFDYLPGRSFYGSDGSREMISYLKADHELASRYEAILEFHWKDLPSLFLNQGKFDAIFLLGNSISHVRTLEEIEEVIAACDQGLNNGGRLILDMREWRNAGNGASLLEHGRAENVKRLLLTETADGVSVKILDLCRYDSGHQIIDYFIEENERQTTTVSFSYLMVLPERVSSCIHKTGFRILFEGRPNCYPYYVFCAEKRTPVR